MHRTVPRPARGDVRRALHPVRIALAATAVLAGGCASTPCELAAQLCADQGRAAAPNEGAEQADCAGVIEAQADCLVDEDSCAPDVVEACWKSARGEDEERD